jgi:hypothetical protein
MDGKILSKNLSILLREDIDTSSFIEDKATYDFIYQAVCEFVRLTGCLTGEQVILTVASTQAYDLNPDFISLYMTNDRNEYFVKLNNGTSDYFITERDYDASYYENNTTDTDVPSSFSMRNKQSLAANISGAATGNGASVGGASTLTNAAAPFASVKSGDIVHNVTDGSDGIVISKTSNSAIVTGLFGGTNNDWSTADAYVIVFQPVKQLILNEPSLTAAYTITVPYIKRPDPVYSDYGLYNIDQQYLPSIIKYAAWLYKYRDSQPNFGDQWYKHWDTEVRKAKSFEKKIRKSVNLKVNFVKRTMYDRSWR